MRAKDLLLPKVRPHKGHLKTITSVGYGILILNHNESSNVCVSIAGCNRSWRKIKFGLQNKIFSILNSNEYLNETGQKTTVSTEYYSIIFMFNNVEVSSKHDDLMTQIVNCLYFLSFHYSVTAVKVPTCVSIWYGF